MSTTTGRSSHSRRLESSRQGSPGPLAVVPPGKRPHKQTWIKVNAPVDDGVAALIRSLNAFPRLQTIESCQGGPDRPAWVCFSYGEYWNDSWRDLANFVLGYLGPGLARATGDGASITLRVTNAGLVRAELTVRPGATHATVKALRRLLQHFDG